jgi:hypothetical protein
MIAGSSGIGMTSMHPSRPQADTTGVDVDALGQARPCAAEKTKREAVGGGVASDVLSPREKPAIPRNGCLQERAAAARF